MPYKKKPELTPQQKLLQTLQRWQRAKACVDGLHQAQRAFVWAKDPFGAGYAPLVALLSPRRWGKTEACLRYAGYLCMLRPRRSVLFVSIQRQSAYDIAFPIITELEDAYGWGGKYNSITYTYTFPNGSRIKLIGADREDFARLRRGTEHDLVIVDEAQDFIYIDLGKLVRTIFEPTLDDRQGRLLLCGTPGDEARGFFYEVISRKHKDWVFIEGHEYENPHNVEQIKRREDALRRADPDVENKPWFLRERRGKWVADDKRLVLRVGEDNLVDFYDEWEEDDEYVLAINWRSNKPSYYALGSWNALKDQNLVLLEGFEAQLGFLDHIRLIDSEAYSRATGVQLPEEEKGYVQRYPNLRIVANIDKEAQATLYESYGIDVEGVKIKDMFFFNSRLQDELTLNKILLYNKADPDAPEDHPLFGYYRGLTWGVDKKTKEEFFSDQSGLHEAVLMLRNGAFPEQFEVEEETIKTMDEIIYEKKRERFSRERHSATPWGDY